VRRLRQTAGHPLIGQQSVSRVICDRPIGYPHDFRPVRDFLSRLYPVASPGTVWDLRRWDGAILYATVPGLAADRAVRSRLWFTDRGRIVAAALSEGGPQIHPHVAPEVGDVLDEVVAWAEAAAAAVGDDRVLLTVWEHDEATRRVANARGYERTEGWETLRALDFGGALLPRPVTPREYLMRSTRDDPADHAAIADLLNAAFGRTFHTAVEYATFTQFAPSFRRETDLVMEAPDGTLAAYAAVCWDSVNQRATFEPVCTHPHHRRRGLARALMLEGMHRAADLGAVVIDVASGSADPADALYKTLPFAEVHRGSIWVRHLPRGLAAR
jgi:mycothiol synthase